MSADHQNQLTISIENFGPIREGSVDLRPLTVFIGPNNSGKSYLALLAYAAWQALSGKLRRPLGAGTFTDYLDQLMRNSTSRVPYNDLPADRQEALRTGLHGHQKTIDEDLRESFRQYFSCQGLDELIRDEDSGLHFALQLGGENIVDPLLSINATSLGTIIDWGRLEPAWLDAPIIADAGISPLVEDPVAQQAITRQIWSQTLFAHGLPSGNVYYLPAARSGILTGLEFFTSMAFDAVVRAGGVEAIYMPPFSRAAADFLQLMLSLMTTPNPSSPDARLQSAIDMIEENVLGGQIVVRLPDGRRRLSLAYESGNLELPIQRASSMVAELAPLDLWLKHRIRPGDWLIIDEPEAHLHPENQRLIARVLVRLVRAGVRVICPTHSSTILHQLSNAILANQSSPDTLRELGLTVDDGLSPADISVYLFEPQSDGAHISPVEIESDIGISEEEFVRVSEAIGEETYRLSMAMEDRFAGAQS